MMFSFLLFVLFDGAALVQVILVFILVYLSVYCITFSMYFIRLNCVF